MISLNIGIIGAGNIGRRQAAHWSRVPGATVVAVADNVLSVAQSLAETLPRPAVALENAETLLARDDVNAIHLCVPTHLHRDIAIAAAHAGKHILCEKPMALSLEDCDAMTTAASTGNVLLSVGHVVRFFPEYVQAKRVVESGRVGAPAVVRTRRAVAYPRNVWFTNPAQSGGVITDLVVHDLDWLLWCFGPVVRVYARVAREPDLEYALITLRHANGVISHAEGIWGEPTGFHSQFEIAGDSGLLTHDSRKARALVATLRPGIEGNIVLQNSPLATADDPYYRQVLAFADAIRGNAPLAVTAEEGRAAVALALAAVESAQTGNAVEL